MENPKLMEGAFSDITLRDLFAGMAMHAFQSNPEEYWGMSDDQMKTAAKYAYQQADAMLEARQ